jgi:hypothetical protein
MTLSPDGVAPDVPTLASLGSGRRVPEPCVAAQSSMVWPCFAALVPMTVAMLPEPRMVIMMSVPPRCGGEFAVPLRRGT